MPIGSVPVQIVGLQAVQRNALRELPGSERDGPNVAVVSRFCPVAAQDVLPLLDQGPEF